MRQGELRLGNPFPEGQQAQQGRARLSWLRELCRQPILLVIIPRSRRHRVDVAVTLGQLAGTSLSHPSATLPWDPAAMFGRGSLFGGGFFGGDPGRWALGD